MGDFAQLQRVFSDIYSQGTWGNGSGPGSAPRNTIEYRSFLENFIRANQVATITDLGCGDWQFSRLLDFSGCTYTGFDVVPEVVERNRARFGAPNVNFQILDGPEALPGGDLLVSKEVLQHLPNQTAMDYLKVALERYKYCLITNNIEPEPHCNVDTHPGGCRPLRMDRPPFSIKGALVSTYYVFADGSYWKNGVFLALGAGS